MAISMRKIMIGHGILEYCIFETYDNHVTATNKFKGIHSKTKRMYQKQHHSIFHVLPTFDSYQCNISKHIYTVPNKQRSWSSITSSTVIHRMDPSGPETQQVSVPLRENSFSLLVKVNRCVAAKERQVFLRSGYVTGESLDSNTCFKASPTTN